MNFAERERETAVSQVKTLQVDEAHNAFLDEGQCGYWSYKGDVHRGGSPQILLDAVMPYKGYQSRGVLGARGECGWNRLDSKLAVRRRQGFASERRQGKIEEQGEGVPGGCCFCGEWCCSKSRCPNAPGWKAAGS